MPRTRLADGWAPEKVPGKRLEECSKLCVLKADCLAFNYIPKMLQCELLRQTRDDTVNMKPDLQSIHFEMIPNHGKFNHKNSLMSNYDKNIYMLKLHFTSIKKKKYFRIIQ